MEIIKKFWLLATGDLEYLRQSGEFKQKPYALYQTKNLLERLDPKDLLVEFKSIDGTDLSVYPKEIYEDLYWVEWTISKGFNGTIPKTEVKLSNFSVIRSRLRRLE